MAVIALLCLFLPGCSKEEGGSQPAPLRTILFYIGGDNNLSGEADKKTEQLQHTAVPASCRLIVYCDSRHNAPRLLEAGNGRLSVIKEYEESNSADAEVFAAVLREVVALYPAPSYGLMLFSHASGWMPEGTYNNPALRSVIIDNEAEMEISALAAAIPDDLFEFIIFETCFMAGVEVAWELKNKTKYIIASSAEIVSPGFKPVYTEALPLLLNPAADLTGFCRKIEANYGIREADYGSLTLSLIDTRGLDGIVDILRGVIPPAFNEDIQAFDRYGGKLFFDLYDCYAGLMPGKQANLQAAIEACVVWKAATKEFMPAYGGFKIRAHSGLTTYVPQERYCNLNEAYKSLKWYKAVFE